MANGDTKALDTLANVVEGYVANGRLVKDAVETLDLVEEILIDEGYSFDDDEVEEETEEEE